MDSNLFINSDVIAALIAFFFGTILTLVLQFFNERRQKAELRYSKTTEQTFALLKKEVRDDLAVEYKGNPVDSLSYFRLDIANTGRKAVRKQSFTCSFPEKTSILKEPDVTHSSPEVGPIQSIGIIQGNNYSNTEVMYRYEIGKIGVGDTVTIEFFATNNPINSFRVNFGPNDEQDVSFIEGPTLSPPTLENHLWKIIVGLLGFFIAKEVFVFTLPLPIIGISPEGVGTILAFPFILFFVIPSLRPVVSAIAEKLQNAGEPGYKQSYIHVYGDAINSQFATSTEYGLMANYSAHNYPQTLGTNREQT